MNLSTEFTLPLGLGKSVKYNQGKFYESEINEKTFGADLEGWLDIEELEPGDDGRKIIAMIRDNKCVTIKMAYMDPPEDTFLGLSLGIGPDETEEAFVAALAEQDIKAIIQYNGIVLPDHFVTIELGDSICWWDPNYWGRDGFIESAVAL